MILVCCIWAGFVPDILAGTNRKLVCVGLAGYTALIIVITIQPEPLLTPQFAVERRSGSLSVLCVQLWRIFSAIDQTRSGSRAGKFAGRAISLMQLCIGHGDGESCR